MLKIAYTSSLLGANLKEENSEAASQEGGRMSVPLATASHACNIPLECLHMFSFSPCVSHDNSVRSFCMRKS